MADHEIRFDQPLLPQTQKEIDEMLRSCQDQLVEEPTADDLLGTVIRQQVLQHPLPWRIESDWTEEVRAADGYCIAKCRTYEEAQAILSRAMTDGQAR